MDLNINFKEKIPPNMAHPVLQYMGVAALDFVKTVPRKTVQTNSPLPAVIFRNPSVKSVLADDADLPLAVRESRRDESKILEKPRGIPITKNHLVLTFS